MECKICYEKYNENLKKPYSFQPCSHTFCIECINNLNKLECPRCKREIKDKQPNFDLLEALEELISEVNLIKSCKVTSLVRAKISVRSGDISSTKKLPSNVKFESV